MKTKTQHTPLPWEVVNGEDHQPNSIVMKDSFQLIGTTLDAEDAAFIVRAVNAHEELLEAAKNAVEIFKTDGRFNGEVSAVARLKQAIAKAGVSL